VADSGQVYGGHAYRDAIDTTRTEGVPLVANSRNGINEDLLNTDRALAAQSRRLGAPDKKVVQMRTRTTAAIACGVWDDG
jgi:hypothetical protein